MKKIIILLIIVFICEHQSFGQNSSSEKNINSELIGFKIKNYYQLTVQTGFIQPVNPYFAKSNYTSGNMGADLSYRINSEVALYTEIKYNFLSSKDSAAPHSGYFETTIGARYYVLRPADRRSSFFFEAGFGPYLFLQGSKDFLKRNPDYIDPHGRKPVKSATADNQGQTYESQAYLRMGANIGIGCELVITNAVYFTMKSKLNSVFEPAGCTSYVTGMGGITVKF
jgi:hypothetical protein